MIVFGRHIPGTDTDHIFTVGPGATGERQLIRQAVPEGSCCQSLSPDGSQVWIPVITSDRITPATVRRDGTGYRMLPLHNPTLSLRPGAWSPDGARIAFEGWDDRRPGRNGVYSADAGGGYGPVRVTSSPGRSHDIPLAYSPNGSRILIVRQPPGDGPTGLYVVPSNGGNPLRLTKRWMTVRCCFFGSPASWSPDGRRVAFAGFDSRSVDSNRSAVFVVDRDGTGLRRITAWGDDTDGGLWSPDGRWIAFDRADVVFFHNLFLVHPDGTGLKPITTTPGGYGSCCAVWSPGGSGLLFQRGAADDRVNPWIVTPDRTGLARITRVPGRLDSYSWGS